MRNINTFLLCVYWMNSGITGIQLLGCGFNGLVEVSEKSTFTLTCDGFDAKDSVSWHGVNNEGFFFPVGTCPCCTCSDTLPGLPVSRTNATVSQLTVLSSRTWDNYRFTCFITASPSQKSSCLIHTMYIDLSVITINKSRENLTVMENQAVTFDCSANGRPSPSMTLTDKDKGTLIKSATSPLTHTLPAARCEDTSTYSCLASNGMGKDTTSAANLYVKCTPRLPDDNIVPNTLGPMKYYGQAVTQTFSVMAYPAPSNFSFFFWGPGTSAWSCKSDTMNIVLKMTCTTSQVLFMSTCTLFVDNVTSPDLAGIYSVIVANEHGSVDLKFQVDVDDTTPKSSTTSAGFNQGVGVGVGVTLAAFAVFALLTVVYMWRRKHKLINEGRTMEGPCNSLAPLTSVNKDVSEIPLDSALPSSLYDPLHHSEIGLASQYSDLSQYESVAESRKPKGPEGRSTKMPITHVYHNDNIM